MGQSVESLWVYRNELYNGLLGQPYMLPLGIVFHPQGPRAQPWENFHLGGLFWGHMDFGF